MSGTDALSKSIASGPQAFDLVGGVVSHHRLHGW
jgi:hypothetical protein